MKHSVEYHRPLDIVLEMEDQDIHFRQQVNSMEEVSCNLWCIEGDYYHGSGRFVSLSV